MKIRYIFFGQDLRKTHVGLNAVLKQKNIQLKEKEFALFLNNKQDMFKIISSDTKVVIIFKNPFGSRINPRVIKNLNKYWEGSTINIEKACQKELVNTLKAQSKHIKEKKNEL